MNYLILRILTLINLLNTKKYSKKYPNHWQRPFKHLYDSKLRKFTYQYHVLNMILKESTTNLLESDNRFLIIITVLDGTSKSHWILQKHPYIT